MTICYIKKCSTVLERPSYNTSCALLETEVGLLTIPLPFSGAYGELLAHFKETRKGKGTFSLHFFECNLSFPPITWIAIESIEFLSLFYFKQLDREYVKY